MLLLNDFDALRQFWLTKAPLIGSYEFLQAPVAQWIRASDYGSEGREFESLQARFTTALWAVFFLQLLQMPKNRHFLNNKELLPTISRQPAQIL